MLHNRKRPTSLTQHDLIEVDENVFVQGAQKPVYAGVRKNVFRIVGNSMPGKAIVEVISSTGINAFPKHSRIMRPIANLMKGIDITGQVPSYFKGGGEAPDGSASEGGMAVGAKHSEGGMPGVIKSTGQPIEFEGGEVIITAPAVDDNTKREFEGEMLTNRQILSKINQSGGGVAFADGGEISHCRCSGKTFMFGGETLTDYQIIQRMHSCKN